MWADGKYRLPKVKLRLALEPLDLYVSVSVVKNSLHILFSRILYGSSMSIIISLKTGITSISLKATGVDEIHGDYSRLSIS